jgi:uncharacterized protein with HEPN domain
MHIMHDEDQELILHIIDNILWALDQIQKRFRVIQSSDDFLDSDEGVEKLDSICMQLINIGEALKQIDKITGKTLLVKYSAIEWKKVMGMRDIITHHYFDIDAETVFTVCEEHIPELIKVITEIRNDCSNSS